MRRTDGDVKNFKNSNEYKLYEIQTKSKKSIIKIYFSIFPNLSNMFVAEKFPALDNQHKKKRLSRQFMHPHTVAHSLMGSTLSLMKKFVIV